MDVKQPSQSDGVNGTLPGMARGAKYEDLKEALKTWSQEVISQFETASPPTFHEFGSWERGSDGVFRYAERPARPLTPDLVSLSSWQPVVDAINDNKDLAWQFDQQVSTAQSSGLLEPMALGFSVLPRPEDFKSANEIFE